MSEARKLEELEELQDEESQQQDDMPEVAVLDDASAEYMLKRIREATEQYERMEAWYAMQMEKAKAVRDRTVAWAEHNLRAYFEMVPVKRTKTQQSYELPGGTLKLAKQEPKYDVKDEEMVPWLEKTGRLDLIRVKKEAEWGKLKKELQIKVLEDGRVADNETGEIVPGVTATVREDKFTVKIK